MKEHPILFNGPMVRALLAGQKTQTRRIVTPQPRMVADHSIKPWVGDPAYLMKLMIDTGKRCPYGQPGDRLWVRETFSSNQGYPIYKADARQGIQSIALWKPSIHMPRRASRITLEIVSVRVERLQDISEADARAEGIVDGGCTECGNSEPCGCANPSPDARDSYCHLWGQINGVGSWAANPWVWVVEFRRLS